MKEKLKRLQLKGFVSGVLMMALLTPIVLTATPDGEIVMRELHYGVRVVVNGQPLQTEGIDRPFILEGRTFLPVSTIAQALDIPANWDGTTRTVYIGTIPRGAPFWSTVPFFERSGSGSALVNTGTVNILGRPHANTIHIPGGHASGFTAWSRHNLNAQFTTLTGTLGRIDGRRGTSSISFIGDGRELASFSVNESSQPIEISVDVTGVLVLQIELRGGASTNNIAFIDAMIQ